MHNVISAFQSKDVSLAESLEAAAQERTALIDAAVDYAMRYCWE